MKPPYFVVEGGDVNIFPSIDAVERGLESPDIECYRVFDADGQVLNLISDAPRPRSTSFISLVVVGKVKVVPRDPPEMASTELAHILSNYLERLTGRPVKAINLGDLIQEIKRKSGT